MRIHIYIYIYIYSYTPTSVSHISQFVNALNNLSKDRTTRKLSLLYQPDWDNIHVIQ